MLDNFRDNNLEDDNFLNSQNYVFWKSEKKKIFLKYFLELNLKNLYTVFTIVNNFLGKYFTIIFLFLVIILWLFFNKNSFFLFLIYIIPLFLEKNIYKHNWNYVFTDIHFKDIVFPWIYTNIKIDSIKSYFINDENEYTISDYGINFIIILKTVPLLWFFWFLFFHRPLPDYVLNNINNFIVPVLFLLFWVVYYFFVKKFKILNLLFSPFVFSYQFFVSLFFFLYVFVYKKYSWFLVVKNVVAKNILHKFVFLWKWYAKNTFYTLKTK